MPKVLLICQDVLQSVGLAGRAYVLENSRIVMEGKGPDLLQDPKVKEAYLGIWPLRIAELGKIRTGPAPLAAGPRDPAGRPPKT